MAEGPVTKVVTQPCREERSVSGTALHYAANPALSHNHAEALSACPQWAALGPSEAQETFSSLHREAQL